MAIRMGIRQGGSNWQEQRQKRNLLKGVVSRPPSATGVDPNAADLQYFYTSRQMANLRMLPVHDDSYGGIIVRGFAFFVDFAIAIGALLLLTELIVMKGGIEYLKMLNAATNINLLGFLAAPDLSWRSLQGVMTFQLGLFLMFWQALIWSLQEISVLETTFGKLLTGLITTDAKGQKQGFIQAFWRNFIKGATIVKWPLDFMCVMFSSKRQSFHCLMSGTYAVKAARLS